MTETMALQVVTPDTIAYSAQVQMVTLPAVDGQIGILPHHVPLITRCVPGEMIVRRNGQDEVLALGQALVEVTGDAALHADSSEELAEAMLRLASDRALREQLAEEGRERAKHFTWRRCAEATREVYRSLQSHS